MVYEERLEAAERRRHEGNDLFGAGSTSEALGKYAMGLSYLNEELLMQLEGVHLDKANAVRLPILLNIAACHLRLQDFSEAIGCCSQAILRLPTVHRRQMHELQSSVRGRGTKCLQASYATMPQHVQCRPGSSLSGLQYMLRCAGDQHGQAERKGPVPKGQGTPPTAAN